MASVPLPEPAPRLVPIRQHFPRPQVDDCAAVTRRELERLDLAVYPGQRIAITAGSRGIHDIAIILRTVAGWLRERGAEPVLVAAMGSHGGGTAEGQRRVLASLGITEASVGAPIVADMATREVTHTRHGLPVWCAEAALACTGILVVNRVKPHTIFREPFGSGLQKMLAIGLGQVPGARTIHRHEPAHMPIVIADMAEALLTAVPIIGGLAIVENGYGETALIRSVHPREFSQADRELFRVACELLPRLPVDRIDVLIVEEMGKNYSGTGMDTTIIGRWRIPGVTDPPVPFVRNLVVLRLSPASHGNALGVGLADITTQALVDAMDRQATYLNCLTSTFIQRAAIPLVAPTERDAIAIALMTLPTDRPRIVRIANTLHLSEVWVSENLVEEATSGGRAAVIGPPQPLAFAPDGHLL